MRSSLLIVSLMVVLSACTFPWTTDLSQKSVEYPTTQSGSPAAAFCTSKGGVVTIEKNPNIPTMDLIFCTPVGGQKVDAWQYMGEQTSQTGAVQVVPAT